MLTQLDLEEFRALDGELAALRRGLLAFEDLTRERLRPIGAHRQSARNLVHYLALRRRDIRPLQERLAAVGLSSLGRAEPCVLATVDAVRRILGALVDGAMAHEPATPPPVGYPEGHALLAANAEALLGAPPDRRRARTMVTLPTEAARDERFVAELVAAGLDLVRVNCAHDDARLWEAMLGHVRTAERAVGRRVRVLMDLGGPKLRTGEIAPGPAVMRLRPRRDALGRVVDPILALLAPTAVVPDAPPELPVVPIADADFLAHLAPGDTIRLTDARDRARLLVVRALHGEGALVESERTLYVVPGLVLEARGGSTVVGALPTLPGRVEVRAGQRLFVTRPEAGPGHSATATTPARIPCTLPEVFTRVRPGDPISFDDGIVSGVVRTADPDFLEVEVVATPEGGARVGPDKGINLPESDLDLPAIGPRDEEDLDFVARHADLVGLSFAERPADVDRLRELLGERGAGHLGIVLKIETRRGFERLPDLLLEAMCGERVGVMIARGDLAVECGWERLAELQEEILWVCEAAHVPVIWATQVLETMTREGRPSRAEITDAAMSERAECVMLNKGPYVVDALRTLVDIIGRMEAHQSKKRAMLRPLALAMHLDA